MIKKILLAGIFAIISVRASAVHYELKEGEQHDVCREYVKELNAVKRKLPMACERHFPTDSKNFKKLNWKSINPKEQSFELFREMFDMQQNVINKNMNTDEGWKWFLQEYLMPAINEGTLDMHSSLVDIDSDGIDESLLRIRIRRGIGGCEAETKERFLEGDGLSPEEFEYYVKSSKTGHLDKRYGSYVLTGGEFHDLFVYKGRTYLDSFIGISTKEKLENSSKSPLDPEGTIEILQPAMSRYGFGARNMCLVYVYYQLN